MLRRLAASRALQRRARTACTDTAALHETQASTDVDAVALAQQAAAREVAALRERLRVPVDAPLRLALGLSGGVDSALCGALLQRLPSVHLLPVFMKNWDEADETQGGTTCNFLAERESARQVAQHLRLPLTEVDFVREYWHTVFRPFLDAAAAGGTPNPDLACNRHIKFGALQRWALTHGNVHALVTGHYARLRSTHARDTAADAGVYLVRGVDETKDQSYFLASVPGASLSRACFPLGCMTKRTVRAAAAALNIPTAEKRSSAGICFVGRRPFGEFLGSYVAPAKGRFIDVDASTSRDGTADATLPSHKDAHAFTHGQRARIGGQSTPWYVAGKCPSTPGAVFVARGKHHPALYCNTAVVGALFWVHGDAAPPPPLAPVSGQQALPVRLQYKARYGQALASAHVTYIPTTATGDVDSNDGSTPAQWLPSSRCIPLAPHVAAPEGGACPGVLRIAFDAPERAVTPGQALVLYDGDVCLGGGVILHPGPSLHEETERRRAFSGESVYRIRSCF